MKNVAGTPSRVSQKLHDRLVYRIMKETGCTIVEANTCLEAGLDFMDRADSSQGRCSPTKLEDVAWHAFILHTPEYARYCQQRFGRFLHHCPTWPPHQPTPGDPNALSAPQKYSDEGKTNGCSLSVAAECQPSEGSGCHPLPEPAMASVEVCNSQHPSHDCGNGDDTSDDE